VLFTSPPFPRFNFGTFSAIGHRGDWASFPFPPFFLPSNERRLRPRPRPPPLTSEQSPYPSFGKRLPPLLFFSSFLPRNQTPAAFFLSPSMLSDLAEGAREFPPSSSGRHASPFFLFFNPPFGKVKKQVTSPSSSPPTSRRRALFLPPPGSSSRGGS